MGLVKVAGGIGLDESNLQDVEFLVETGSFYTMLPPRLAREAGITFPVTSRVTLADSCTVEVGVGVAFLRLEDRRLEDREGGVIVASMDVPMPLLGASALEALGFKPEFIFGPVTETLETTRPFGPAVLAGAT